MPRFKAITILLLLVMTVPAIAMPAWKSHPDQTVDTPVGKFTLTKLRTIRSFGILTIQGELVNDTSKAWDSVYFALELTDKNGAAIPKKPPLATILLADPKASMQIHARNIPPGAKFKINVDIDNFKVDGDSLSMVFKYGFGEYPLTYKLALVKPTPSDSMEFSDDNISLAFVPAKTALNFVLKNKADAPIKVDWNTVSFVSPEGTAQGVIHNGVKLIDRTAPKAPSMVPPRAKIDDAIVPVENIELVETEWVTHPLLPAGPAGLRTAGQEFSVFMPLDVGGTSKNYNFVFKIVSAE